MSFQDPEKEYIELFSLVVALLHYNGGADRIESRFFGRPESYQHSASHFASMDEQIEVVRLIRAFLKWQRKQTSGQYIPGSSKWHVETYVQFAEDIEDRLIEGKFLSQGS